MELSTWAAFFFATLLVRITPGSTSLLVVNITLNQGKKYALVTAVGSALGSIAIALSAMLVLKMAASMSLIFLNVVQWSGAVYASYLGLKLLWAAHSKVEVDNKYSNGTSNAFSLFKQMVLVGCLNPKSATFFISFTPHFLSKSWPILPQLTIFGVTFVVLGFLNVLMYSFITDWFRKKEKILSVKWLNSIGGCIMIVSGIAVISF